MKHIKPFAVLIFSLSITACSTEEVGEAAPLPTANFKATGTMHDFMVWNLEPAADALDHLRPQHLVLKEVDLLVDVRERLRLRYIV